MSQCMEADRKRMVVRCNIWTGCLSSEEKSYINRVGVFSLLSGKEKTASPAGWSQ